jgi:peptide/nickel transport system permease protein
VPDRFADRRAIALALGVALGAVALAMPALAPLDPDVSLDPAAARDRPPGTTLYPVELGDGRVWLVDAQRPAGDGGLLVWRRGAPSRLPAGAWRPLSPVDPRAAPRHFHLGTDALGRDLWSRILHGLRNSLSLALGAALVASATGCMVGAAAALGGRRVDALVMRGVDVCTAVPKLFLVLAAAAAARPGATSLLAMLAALTWMPTARLVRAELLALDGGELGMAARAVGCSPGRIFVRHHLPHLAGPLLVQTALASAELVLLEAALSFLGAGLPPPTASLGGLLAEAATRPLAPWWSLLFPGLAVALPPLLLTAGAGAWETPLRRPRQRPRSHRSAAAGG